MGIPRFFKIPKHRQFNYIPRYYDERKEAMEERLKRAKRENGEGNDKEPYKPNIRGQMRGYFKKNIKEKKQSNIRLLVILLVLFLISYYLIFY
ncbi:MAG: hypothetical protein KAT68_03455 [Bacteroidales bacterium]|nr:hypothetical protein [Bacteroidales bacterium]